ncbi:hypothetical protein ABIA16_001732 [Sinorhizobium fredii]
MAKGIAGAKGAPITLKPEIMALLAIVAAHDGESPEEFLTRAICRRIEEIGLGSALDTLKVGVDQ